MHGSTGAAVSSPGANMPSSTGRDLIVDFMCQSIRSRTACQLTKQRQANDPIGSKNTNQDLPWEEDLLITHAQSDYQLLGGTEKAERFVGRHDATILLRERLHSLNLTMKDLPQLDLTAQQEKVVWRRTWDTELLLWPALHGGLEPNKTELWETTKFAFEEDRRRFSHVDAIATLRNETWRSLLFPPCLYLRTDLRQACSSGQE